MRRNLRKAVPHLASVAKGRNPSYATARPVGIKEFALDRPLRAIQQAALYHTTKIR